MIVMMFEITLGSRRWLYFTIYINAFSKKLLLSLYNSFCDCKLHYHGINNYQVLLGHIDIFYSDNNDVCGCIEELQMALFY